VQLKWGLIMFLLGYLIAFVIGAAVGFFLSANMILSDLEQSGEERGAHPKN